MCTSLLHKIKTIFPMIVDVIEVKAGISFIRIREQNIYLVIFYAGNCTGTHITCNLMTSFSNSRASSVEAYEDMFKEITRKLYGEEATTAASVSDAERLFKNVVNAKWFALCNVFS